MCVQWCVRGGGGPLGSAPLRPGTGFSSSSSSSFVKVVWVLPPLPSLPPGTSYRGSGSTVWGGCGGRVAPAGKCGASSTILQYTQCCARGGPLPARLLPSSSFSSGSSLSSSRLVCRLRGVRQCSVAVHRMMRYGARGSSVGGALPARLRIYCGWDAFTFDGVLLFCLHYSSNYIRCPALR
jgi:hypothetical protein